MRLEEGGERPLAGSFARPLSRVRHCRSAAKRRIVPFRSSATQRAPSRAMVIPTGARAGRTPRFRPHPGWVAVPLAAPEIAISANDGARVVALGLRARRSHGCPGPVGTLICGGADV